MQAYPAVKGKLGNWNYYQTSLKAAELARLWAVCVKRALHIDTCIYTYIDGTYMPIGEFAETRPSAA